MECERHTARCRTRGPRLRNGGVGGRLVGHPCRTHPPCKPRAWQSARHRAADLPFRVDFAALSARDAAGGGAAGTGAADTEDAPGDPVAQRVAALEVETARLARLAHLARLSRWDTDPDSDDSAERHRSAGPNTRFASRYGVPSGTSRFDPTVVAGWGGGPEDDFIMVQVAGDEGEHRVPLPAQWQHASFCIRELKMHLVELLGIGVSPIGTSLLVHLQSGATFQATSGLTLPQAFIRRGSKVTLNKTPTPTATPHASTSSSESPGS